MRPVTIAEAAMQLDITKEAVRKRISRGTLEAVKGEDGRWLIYVDQDDPEPAGDIDSMLVQRLQDKVELLEGSLAGSLAHAL